ncbi:MAG TPA: 2-phospho-L-lactate guanylyltransferase [Allosphingosinicella sp.]|jgi:2-phospho-L-lactate guanylyltransferase
MNWTVIVPLKQEGSRKTRLRDVLTDEERAQLGERWFRHVAGMVGQVPGVRLIILSDRLPDGCAGDWRPDEGRGLNEELQAARRDLGAAPVAILHADLPHLGADDVAALLEAAERSGCAIAPDRHGTGTNGLAIADARPFRFAFGPGSFALHRASAGAPHETVDRFGLALDVDTPDDLAAASGEVDRFRP